MKNNQDMKGAFDFLQSFCDKHKDYKLMEAYRKDGEEFTAIITTEENCPLIELTKYMDEVEFDDKDCELSDPWELLEGGNVVVCFSQIQHGSIRQHPAFM